jgi:DNA-binding NarL/FixJ family response regulator
MLAGSNVKIVAETSSYQEVVKQANKAKPDVVLLDLRLGEQDGFELIEKLRRDLPKCKVVVLSVYDNPTYVARSVALGAHDYLLKDCTRSELVGAITAAADGKGPTSAGLMQRVAAAMKKAKSPSEKDIPLTSRELQVVRHLALGLSNKEIARSLDISVETVKEHVQNLLRKLQSVDRTQAAVWAVRQKLV